MRTLLLATTSIWTVLALALVLALTLLWRRARRGAPLAFTATLLIAPLAGVSLALALAFRPLRRLLTR